MLHACIPDITRAGREQRLGAAVVGSTSGGLFTHATVPALVTPRKLAERANVPVAGDAMGDG